MLPKSDTTTFQKIVKVFAQQSANSSEADRIENVYRIYFSRGNINLEGTALERAKLHYDPVISLI